jgi:hypothetical protein
VQLEKISIITMCATAAHAQSLSAVQPRYAQTHTRAVQDGSLWNRQIRKHCKDALHEQCIQKLRGADWLPIPHAVEMPEARRAISLLPTRGKRIRNVPWQTTTSLGVRQQTMVPVYGEIVIALSLRRQTGQMGIRFSPHITIMENVALMVMTTIGRGVKQVLILRMKFRSNVRRRWKPKIAPVVLRNLLKY